MFLTVSKDVLTMLMTSLARDASALGSIEVEVEGQLWVMGVPSEYTSLAFDSWLKKLGILARIHSRKIFLVFVLFCFFFKIPNSHSLAYWSHVIVPVAKDR